MADPLIGSVTDTFDSLPPPDEAYRGQDVFVTGASGVADIKAFCRKSTDDEYEWVLYQVPQASFMLGSNSFFEDLDAGGFAIGLGAVGSGSIYGALVAIDLTSYRFIRHRGTVTDAGSAGSTMWLQYSTDGSTWADLTTNTIDLTNVSAQVTDWELIPDAAKTLVAIRFFAAGGDGVADPNVITNILQAKG